MLPKMIELLYQSNNSMVTLYNKQKEVPFGELGLVVDSSCLSPWVGEPVTPAGGYHTSVDVWLTGTYHA